MAKIMEPSGEDELSAELDADIQKLSHDEAIGCIRGLVSGGWVSASAVTLAMRVQVAASLRDGLRSGWLTPPSAKVVSAEVRTAYPERRDPDLPKENRWSFIPAVGEATIVFQWQGVDLPDEVRRLVERRRQQAGITR